MIIKAENITNLTDARYFAAREVAFLGFCLDSSNEHFVSTAVVKAMKEWIEGPKIVGEFGLQSSDEILESIDAIGLDAVQLSMFSPADKSFLQSKATIFQEIIVEKNTKAAELWQLTEDLGKGSDFIVLNFEKNGIAWSDLIKHSEINIELLQRICQKHKVLLSLIFSPNQLKTIINVLEPSGISILGGEEEKVGVKSFDEIDEIFDILEA